MRIGVEVGGTFTDLVAIDHTGVRVLKVPSTPRNPDEGAFNALLASDVDIGEISDLAHGSTVATNAVLERKGFPISFITTHGFRDILTLQRHGRSRIYDLEYARPEPVVDRSSTFEVIERILADGSIATPLDEVAVERDLIPRIKAGGYEAVAVCLLNAYTNPAHERALKAIIQKHIPGFLVTLSSEVTREFREFERASTTTLSAYVQPVMDRYISRFESRLDQSGFKGRFSVMQSNGGRLPGEAMRESAVTALLSGPAAGVMGAARQAARSNFKNLITLDIGGTSTDVCVVTAGKPQLTQEFTIDGLPVRLPVLDINTVGAGGGSIIWIDDGGMLRVGPHSAGAEPGPACYGRGGKQPTLTDAHVVRQTIRPEAFLGGRMEIDVEAARAALEPIARHFKMSLEEAADSAIQLANANIVRAIQLISTERGHDPRDYVLVPYGGAGPLHAAAVAEDLGITSIVVAPNSGVLSAYGLLASDFVLFDSMTRRAPVDENAPDVVREVFAEMKKRALDRARMMKLGDRLDLTFVADMRFVGQAFEVPVELPIDGLEALESDSLTTLFGEAHERVYFFGAEPGKPVEMVSFRLGMTAPLDSMPILAESSEYSVERREIDLFLSRKWRKGLLASRGTLDQDVPMSGPALLEDPTSTLLVPLGWSARRDRNDNMILTRENNDDA
ncbi:hydantoinase/oxoprolinase family protein [Aureimonas fodinaquatilis]|uniref:Hydantoinase/oxoprolinase family protein n=1 Tax=Aureimonas fodinaquatilis TaxID=2565783 RepID=A0A5B0E217_9HYPH|nr:hydantoinase/oxoprolinase family protein [Aureimonas fodinaquatilis]KAA0972001.1 hydantoinase/oxoprolinase family protein [Aureimonas fodinaquatilis]